MVIAVFGGSGKTGFLFIRHAIDQGFGVRALLRNVDSLPDLPGLTKIQGNASDGGKLMLTLSGAEAVFLCLGLTKNNPHNIVSLATELIVQGMKRYKINRLIAITSMGVGDSKDQVPFLFKVFGSLFMKKALEDKELQEKIIMNSDLEWTILRPSQLIDEPTPKSRIGLDKDQKAEKISREQVANAALDFLQNGQYMKKTPYIT